MNPLEQPLMLNDARDRAAQMFDRYPAASVVEVRVDGVKYTFRRDAHDMTLVSTKRAN